jgi:hypothetical protein
MLVAMAVVALFALVGVASAAVFIADKASGSSSSHKGSSNAGSTLAAQNIARARAQATAIVAAAQSASQHIVKSATRSARTSSNQILASARRKAAQIVASANASTASSTTSSTTSPSAPTTSQSTTSAQPGTASGPAVGPTSTASTGYTPLPPGTPNFSQYPSSWQVIAYNVAFGSGAGSAGSISIANRGTVPFSGVARVYYVGGGSSRAIFTAIPPGQTETLPLDGRAYTGRGYTIRVKHLHS